MPGGRAVALRRGAAGPRMLGHRLGATCGEGGRALAMHPASWPSPEPDLVKASANKRLRPMLGCDIPQRLPPGRAPFFLFRLAYQPDTPRRFATPLFL